MSDLARRDFAVQGRPAERGSGRDEQVGPGLRSDRRQSYRRGVSRRTRGVPAVLGQLSCPNVVVTIGNHDARNVGYRPSRTSSAPASRRRDLEPAAREGGRDRFREPDLDEGEVGREHYGWVDAELAAGEGRDVVIHHHVLAVPGTGRDSTTCATPATSWPLLRELEVDLVLAATAMSRTSGASRASGSCTPAPCPRSACGAPCRRPTTSSISTPTGAHHVRQPGRSRGQETARPLRAGRGHDRPVLCRARAFVATWPLPFATPRSTDAST